MNKKIYSIPSLMVVEPNLSDTYLLSASDEGIHDGGEGDDDDDPTVKQRDDSWGNLW